MIVQFLQMNRSLQVTTPALEGNVLLVEEFRGTEALSSLFQFELDLVSLVQVSLKDLLGQPIALSLRLADGSFRYFSGRIRRFVLRSRNAQGLMTYRAEVVPWLWFLGLTQDCRIFQGKSVQEIITEIFEDNGASKGDFEFRGLKGGQQKREYCVQYQDSALNFVSRLLEEEGIYYFFEHTKDKHILVLADSPSQHRLCPGQPTARYELGSKGGTREDDVVFEAIWSQEVQPGKVALGDFNFESPSTGLTVDVEREKQYEVFEYPGGYLERSRGSALARVRLEERGAAVYRLEGSSSCRAFCPGYRFELKSYFRSEVEPAQVLCSVKHKARQDISSLLGGNVQTEPFAYENSFSSFPYSVPYRPPRNTCKPIVQGTQTAMVVGKQSEEITTDRYGRVKLQFHWDRRGKKDEKSSCWVRVAQNWAGKQWGAMFVPRYGQEVIVDFLEGDPDRPIIIGRVYNAEQMPPYELPDDGTKSTIKSNSSKDAEGFNELRFEDKAGKEEIYLHGQKDLTIEILNDKNQTIGHDESLSVGHDRTKSVGNNETISVGQNRATSVGQNDTTNIGANESTTVGANRTVTVMASQAVTVALGAAESIGLGKALSIGAGYQVTVGGAMNTTVGASQTEEVGLIKKVIVGNKFELVCGAGKITIEKSGKITIEGTEFQFVASGPVQIQGTDIDLN